MQNNAKQCKTMWELSLRHMRSQVSACVLFACPGVKQAEQVEVLTGSFILLVDLLPEQQWNICLADTATEGTSKPSGECWNHCQNTQKLEVKLT